MSFKRGRFNSQVTSDRDLDLSSSRRTVSPWSEDHSDLTTSGDHQRKMELDPPLGLIPPAVFFSSSNIDTDEGSPQRPRFPLVPKPRFPSSIFFTPSLYSPSASLTAPVHQNVNIHNLITPFCFTPIADQPTAVPSGSPPLPPPPPFSFYHPAFWAAMPYLIGRALQVRKSPNQSAFPVHSDSHFSCPAGLCPPWESRTTRRRNICDTSTPPPNVELRTVLEASSSGLEDMAKMVSRLDEIHQDTSQIHVSEHRPVTGRVFGEGRSDER